MAKKVEAKSHYKPVKKEKSDTKQTITTEQTESKNDLVKYSLKIAGITVLGIVFVFYYLVSILIGIAPSASADIFASMGSKKALMISYEQMYRKTESIETLYNLVQLSKSNNDHRRVSIYSTALMGRDDYEEFVTQVNEASRSAAPLNKVAYVYDLDSYLMSIYIEAIYNMGKKNSAWMYIYEDIAPSNTKVYTNSITSYVNCVYNDESLTFEEKQGMFGFFTNSIDQGGEVRTLAGWVHKRLSIIEEQEEQTREGKIFNIYSQIKMNTCLYRIYDILEDDVLKEIYRKNIQELQPEYNYWVTAEI